MQVVKDFLESNRYKHFLVSAAGSLLTGAGFAIGANLATEYKDKAYGNKWDWKDFAFGIAGGVVGQILQAAIIYCIWS